MYITGIIIFFINQDPVMSTFQRQTETAVDPQFPGRWSPRAFAPQPVAEAHLLSLFEAARWAPSASNSQPWLFLLATTPEERSLYLDLLHPGNQIWAREAPVLLFLLTQFRSPSGRERESAEFDAGSAWISLALQAHQLGLYAHAMAGFDHQRVYTALQIPADEYKVMVAIAVGHYGDPAQLSEELQAREHPSPRKPLAEVFRHGRFQSAGE